MNRITHTILLVLLATHLASASASTNWENDHTRQSSKEGLNQLRFTKKQPTEGKDTLWNYFPQFFDHPFRSVKSKSFLSVEGGYTLDAGTLNNHFLWRVANKSPLSNEVINQNADRLGLRNLFGIDGRGSATYYNLNKGFAGKDSLHYLVRYGFVDHGGASFTDDLFRLVGQGNKVFEGDTAFGNGLTFKRYRFDYIDFGLIKFFPNRSNLQVSVGVTRGLRMIDVDASRLLLYTAPYGTSAYLDVDLNARFSAGDKQGLQHVNGMGAQINFDYRALLGPGGDGAVAIGARNLGFMQWKGSEYQKKDTFSYSGWHIDPSTFSNPGNGSQAYDSLSAVFQPDSSGFKQIELLPAYLYAEYTMRIGGKQSLNFRFDKVINSPMLPRVSVGYTYFFGNWYGISTVSTGGFSRLNIAQEAGYRVGRHSARVMIYGVHAMILPGMAGGLGGQAGYMLMF